MQPSWQDVQVGVTGHIPNTLPSGGTHVTLYCSCIPGPFLSPQIREIHEVRVSSTKRAGLSANAATSKQQDTRAYLEGQGDSVSRLIIGITRVTILVVWVTNSLTKSP